MPGSGLLATSHVDVQRREVQTSIGLILMTVSRATFLDWDALQAL